MKQHQHRIAHRENRPDDPITIALNDGTFATTHGLETGNRKCFRFKVPKISGDADGKRNRT